MAAYNNKNNLVHGMLGTRIYATWQSMIQRCTYKRHKDWARYGGRGITVCRRWSNSFSAFYADMGPKPSGKSLERKDSNLGYYKDNCKWATAYEQSINRKTTRYVTAFGRTQCVAEWSKENGLLQTTILKRLGRGWSPNRSVTNEKEAK